VSIPLRVAGAIGSWVGSNKLWFDPTQAAIECETSAEIRGEAAGRMLRISYAWEYDGKPCEGVLVLGDDAKAGRCDASWADSFHNGHRLMPLTGPAAGEGIVSVTGSYSAPPGPDWGWRITLEHPSSDAFVMRMHNITPDGTEALAVEASYARRR
jgi:hypothetical protein